MEEANIPDPHMADTQGEAVEVGNDPIVIDPLPIDTKVHYFTYAAGW
jgi:hypothetical protein